MSRILLSIANNKYKKEVAVRLKYFLKKHFVSQNQAAEFLGTTGNTLRTTYLSGRSLPGYDILSKLSLAGCDLKWLFTGIEDFFHSGFVQNKDLHLKIDISVDKLIELYGDQEDDVPVLPADINIDARRFILAKNIIRRWKYSKSITANNLIEMSELLNIDLSWFFIEDLNKEIDVRSLTKDELELIKNLRTIPDSTKTLLGIFNKENILSGIKSSLEELAAKK